MRFIRQIGRYFVAGAFTLLPLVITISVAIWASKFISRHLGQGTFLGDLVKTLGLRVSSHKTLAYVIGWIAILSVIFLFGVFVEMGARKYFQRAVEGFMRRIPIMGSVYGTATQFVGVLGKKGENELKGMSVVYCSFGSQGGAVFLALMPTSERFIYNGMEHYLVLIPQAPIPVGGGLMLVPVGSVQPSDMSVEQFMSVYLSMGATGPQYMREILAAHQKGDHLVHGES